MSSTQPGPRPRGPSGRGPPSGSSAGPSIRPPPITVNGGAQLPGETMSRAEKFEDEKRRIIESCFGKKEPDGSGTAPKYFKRLSPQVDRDLSIVSESYITHIRILEDAAYPSSPPPLESPQANKKPRIIVIAVRKSGRVRMHKARENNNGSFSIGKTWVLDDLSAIQSYNVTVPSNEEDQQAKERARDIGFVVTIQKPYYWQASTAKEKDFFIYSLIKIYKKYTAGRLPHLSGFDPQELEQFGGGSSMPTNGTPPRAPSIPAGPHLPASADMNGRPSPGPSLGGFERPFMTPQLEQVRDESREPRQRPSQERSFRTDSESFSRPSQERSQRTGSDSRSQPSQESSIRAESENHSRPPQDRVLRSTDSDDRMPHVPGQFPSSEFVRNLKPQTSQPQFPPRRSDSPSSRNGALMQPELNLRRLAGAQNTESFRNGPENQVNRYQSNRRPSEERIRQNGVLGPSNRTESSDSIRPSTTDRHPSANGTPRDSHDLQDRTPGQRLDVNGSTLPTIVPPGIRDTEPREHSRLTDNSNQDPDDLRPEKGPQNRALPNENVAQVPSHATVSDAKLAHSKIDKDPASTMETASNPVPVTSLTEPREPANETEVHRPGLGPMIKSKKSNKEIAATFRNAAKSYNAFKPRTGGAADKLRDTREGSANEPDGITGVVPAPFLLARQRSQAQLKSPIPAQTPAHQPLLPVPSNQAPQLHSPEPTQSITQSYTDERPKEPPTVRISTPPAKRPGTGEGVKEGTPDTAEASPEKAQDELRRKRKSDCSAKYAKALGINQGLLEGRTFEVESVLNDFGWGEENFERNTFEELQSNIRKELARVEAGSWLGSIENNDERIATIGNMMDRVVAECEEFDCLLTLYNVELGVCWSLPSEAFADHCRHSAKT